MIVDLETFSHFPEDRTAIAAGLAEGAGLSVYRFRRHKSDNSGEKKPPAHFQIAAGATGDLGGLQKSLARTSVLVDSTNLARDLANEPANALPPRRFADIARDVAGRHGMKCRVIGPAQMKRLGLGGILSVAAGSDEPAQLVVLEHGKAGRSKKIPTIALVGKGITFDSGGLSIKPAEKMDEMKFDKAGACAVLGAMQAAAVLDLPVHVIGLMPLSENLTGGSAYRPGDVIRMHNGKTVEVISTDAEGRLLVADALSFALDYSPDVLIDLATLTGACVVALGIHSTGLVGNDAALAAKLKAAGERTGERVWEFPSWKEYREQLRSEIADMKNVGGRDAGVITAGLFLKEFVGGKPWAHLDIAGTAWVSKDLPYKPKGACGTGVRLLTDLLARWNEDIPGHRI
jgi:leucyl aminopeptidase